MKNMFYCGHLMAYQVVQIQGNLQGGAKVAHV